MRSYCAQWVADRRARGLDPDPKMVARAEGRHATQAEFDAWERRLGIREGPTLPEPERSFQPSTRSAADSRRARFRSLDQDGAAEEDDEQATAQSRTTRELDAPDVRAWSDFTITVAPSVLSRIEREILGAVWAFDSAVETGGWLLSHYAPGQAEARIILATGPGPSAKHAAGRLQLSHPRELEDELVPGAVLVGDWHTHPTTWTGDPTDQASEPDEEAWKHRLETVTSLSSWVGLIFTPGELGWTNPIYHGYLTHQNENGVVVCNQATVTEGRISPGCIG